MDVLVARITAATGLDAAVVEKAIGIILAFLAKEGPDAEVNRLFDTMPGAQQAAALADEGAPAGGGFLNMFGSGGGVMALGTKLMGAGVPMAQMATLGRELFAHGRETAGEDTMGAIMGAIPGLSQFV